MGASIVGSIVTTEGLASSKPEEGNNPPGEIGGGEMK